MLIYHVSVPRKCLSNAIEHSVRCFSIYSKLNSYWDRVFFRHATHTHINNTTPPFTIHVLIDTGMLFAAFKCCLTRRIFVFVGIPFFYVQATDYVTNKTRSGQTTRILYYWMHSTFSLGNVHTLSSILVTVETFHSR